MVEIFFTKDYFRAHEDPNNNPDGTRNMPVRVIKTSRIANPIVLDVIPLTVEMANTSLLAAEIPVFNPFSPPYAGNITIISIIINFFVLVKIVNFLLITYSTRFS